MARKVKTYSITFEAGVTTSVVDFSLDLDASASSQDALKMTTVSVDYPINAETGKSINVPIEPSSGDAAVFQIPVKYETVSHPIDLPKDALNVVATRNYTFSTIEMIETTSLKIELPSMTGKVKRIDCKPPVIVKTFKSPYLDNAPHTREAINVKNIPFILLSEIASRLASKYKMSYSNIKLIGIFEPIPLHLAEKFVLDTNNGVLKYYIRKEAKGERRFVRIVYARNRETGDIVSDILPTALQ